jgi:hypothetical protein
MRISRFIVPTLLAGALLTSCSGDDESDFEPSGSVDPDLAGNLADDDTVVRVDTGRWSDDVMVPTLVEYLEARQTSMRERRIVPEMIGTATFDWVQQQRSVIADAKERGWTVPKQARMRVVGIDTAAGDAMVQVCMWGPSVDFIEVKTGEPVNQEMRQWYPFDVKMVLADDRWYVAAAAEGDFRCEAGEG